MLLIEKLSDTEAGSSLVVTGQETVQKLCQWFLKLYLFPEFWSLVAPGKQSHFGES